MFDVERETQLSQTPAQLWRVLSNFDGYERWNPYVRPKGVPELRTEVPYWLRMKPERPSFWRVSALVTELEPNARLTFDVKLSWLLSIEERYVLEPRAGGTRLIHSFRCKGLIARLRLSKARRNFEGILSETERFLIAYMQRTDPKVVSAKKRTKRKPRR